ncbi:MAG: phosphoglucosamine mutase [Leptospira sp.]|nr:phosphoglucosamine mutase [Leptospira sp.]
MISVSGIRGTIPDGLDLNNIPIFAQAFSSIISNKQVVIGKDSRPSGLFIESILTGILLSHGKNVISLGIVPTPTVKAVVNATKSGGGVMISASHNPIEWNAFKFIGKNGLFFNQSEMNQLLENIKDNRFAAPIYNPDSKIIEDNEKYIRLHFESVLKRVDVPTIRKRKFKVFVDAVNGGGSIVIPAFLESLGCTVIRHNCAPDGKFPRPPEPTPKALLGSAKRMKSSGADIGFALDPDADRLVLISKKRGAISEELTLPLSIQSILTKKSGKSGKVIINLSSSFVTEDIIHPFGLKLLRSKVGEANVVEKMIREGAVFGGEGNGGVIDPKINSFGRDSLSGIAHVLNVLARERRDLDSVLDLMPEVFMEKMTLPAEGKSKTELFQKLKDNFNAKKLDETDGLRLEFDSSWIHVRSSNTEPIIRVIAEARTKNDLNRIVEKTKEILNK